MNDSSTWPVATLLLAAVAPLVACDDNAIAAPEATPGPVAEAQQPEPEVEIGPLAPATYYFEMLHAGTVVFREFGEFAGDGSPRMFKLADDGTSWEDFDDWDAALVRPSHEVIAWSDFELCHSCELELTEVVRFGDADGPGAIESDAPTVTWSERLGYVVVGSTFLQVFDDDGVFVRRVGQRGEGPGEFGRVVDAHVVDGRLVALDQTSRSWSIFSLAGEFIERRPYGYATGPFAPVGGGRVVVVTLDPSPEVAGLPLHLADVDSGVPSLHFGSWDDAWKSAPYANNVRGSVASRAGTVWWGAAGSPRVQEWSVDDELLRVIEGELPWFPEVGEAVDPSREPPSTLLRSLALNDQEQLWMTVRTADPQWREVELERTSEGYRIPPERRPDYFDTRLDIFDLDGERHLGHYRWDSPYPRLIDLGGEPAVSVVEHTQEMVRQVVIYRVGWSEESPR